MKRRILKLGQFKITVIVAAVTVLTSIIITLATLYFFDVPIIPIAILIPILCPLFIAPPVTWFFVGYLMELDHLRNEFKALASYDSLTGLMTRRAFLESCETVKHLLERKSKPLVLAYLDLDDFKKINDNFGHDAGDCVLKSFAKLIRSNLRTSDLAARIGGEEFIIALPETDIKEAEVVLNRIIFAVRKDMVTCQDAETSINYTTSIGYVQMINSRGQPLVKYIKQADKALYLAKSAGKDQLVLYATKQVINDQKISDGLSRQTA
jgi:diguanylate cyclase (GGDEF)-like protein